MSKTLESYDDAISSPSSPPGKNLENELDALIHVIKRRTQEPADDGHGDQSPLQSLRRLMVNELVPVFMDLVDKYSKANISLQMDASNFLEGGREIKFEFTTGEYRTQLHGTVTDEGIAFHEVRYSPEFHGELATGPMLRLRQLNAKTFREFICDQLTHLLRTSLRRRQ